MLETPWRSDHEVFVYNYFEGSLLDLQTGAKKSLGMFRPSVVDAEASTVRFSPNGQWMLWASYPTYPTKQTLWNATELATFRNVQYPRSLERSGGLHGFKWLPDSRRWAEQITDKGQSYAMIFSVDNPKVTLVPLAAADCWRSFDGSPASASRPAVTPPPSSPQMQAIEHPFSPAGDRIAWFTSADDHSTNWAYYIDSLRTLHRIPHNPIPRRLYSLWVSRSDGGDAHQVIPDFDGEGAPISLHWTPDGKRLGFYFQNALWTAPAN